MAQAGDFRHRVSFYRPKNASETTQNSFGEDLADSVFVGEFWSHVAPLQGSEVDKDGQLWGEGFFSIQLRHQPGIAFNSKMTAFWDDGVTQHNLNIQNINDVVQDSKPIIRMVAREFIG